MAGETSGRDPFLNALVRSADRKKAEDRAAGPSITVVVGGALISGALIGEGQYFSMIVESFSKGAAGDPRLANAAAYFVERDRLGGQDAAEGDYEPSFLHLRNVEVARERGPIKTRDFMVRVPFSEVQGFGLGTLSSTKKDSRRSVRPPAKKKRHR
jgi:hypothetical protein